MSAASISTIPARFLALHERPVAAAQLAVADTDGDSLMRQSEGFGGDVESEEAVVLGVGLVQEQLVLRAAVEQLGGV